MSEPDDITLLRQYARGDESAFSSLFERHVNLVYSIALRQTRNPSHAEEVTQAVFILFARKAKSLSLKTVLSGWLYQAARLTTASLIKREIRRQRREQEVYMQTLTGSDISLWEQISPLLDDAMGRLSEKDRNAIVLRFFENRTPQEVAVALRLNEVAARKRVSRALENLRNVFAKRGVFSTAAIIGGVISANSVQAAPTALANSAAAITIAQSAAVSASTLTLIKGATKAIAMTTFQKAIVTTALVATIGTGIFEAHQSSESQKQIQSLRQQQASLNEQLSQSHRERDDATNQLGGLLVENAHLKSNSNQRELLKLRGQVAAASRAAADAAAKIRNDSEQSQADNQLNQTRANLETFFKLSNLSPEKADQYVNLEVEMKRRQADRMKGLLGGTLSVTEAVRQRDQDNQEQQNQRRELLGPDGWATLQSIADDMREGVAKHLIETIQANTSNNPLTQEQTDRLHSAIKAEVAANTIDDTDLFRPVDEWTQMVTDQQEHVVQAASEFLTPAQQETLQFLERANLAQLLQQREQRRKALGINR
jgi:RNA polymerase sigma factor (sigma-70 family)